MVLVRITAVRSSGHGDVSGAVIETFKSRRRIRGIDVCESTVVSPALEEIRQRHVAARGVGYVEIGVIRLINGTQSEVVLGRNEKLRRRYADARVSHIRSFRDRQNDAYRSPTLARVNLQPSP